MREREKLQMTLRFTDWASKWLGLPITQKKNEAVGLVEKVTSSLKAS
jgi:hypothetical protein